MTHNARPSSWFAAVLAAACLACGGGGSAVPEEDAAAVEAPALSLADLGEVQEARAFLAAGAVWTEDLSPAELRALIDELYAAGAPRVLFDDITDLEGQRVSALLAIEPPADAAARQRVFAVYNRAWASLGDEPEPDGGQPYLTISLD
jgi:hypothetical protein